MRTCDILKLVIIWYQNDIYIFFTPWAFKYLYIVKLDWIIIANYIYWIFIRRPVAEAEAPILWPPDAKSRLIGKDLTHWKRPCCWERLNTGGERDGRGWDGWMASLTQRTWVWANSGRWWKTRKPGMLQSMGSQSRTCLSSWTTFTECLLFASTVLSPFHIWFYLIF